MCNLLLLLFHCNYVSILYSFWDVQRRIATCPWNLVKCHSRSLKNGTIWYIIHTFLSVCNCSTCLVPFWASCLTLKITTLKSRSGVTHQIYAQFVHRQNLQITTDSMSLFSFTSTCILILHGICYCFYLFISAAVFNCYLAPGLQGCFNKLTDWYGTRLKPSQAVCLVNNGMKSGVKKLESLHYPTATNCTILVGFESISACDRQMDGHASHTCMLRICIWDEWQKLDILILGDFNAQFLAYNASLTL